MCVKNVALRVNLALLGLELRMVVMAIVAAECPLLRSSKIGNGRNVILDVEWNVKVFQASKVTATMACGAKNSIVL